MNKILLYFINVVVLLQSVRNGQKNNNKHKKAFQIIERLLYIVN